MASAGRFELIWILQPNKGFHTDKYNLITYLAWWNEEGEKGEEETVVGQGQAKSNCSTNDLINQLIN